MVEQMEQWMEKYADAVKKSFPRADREYPGTGAAGGMGFAFRTFMNASLKSGIQIVLEETGIEQRIKNADLVVTGEGQLDGQTAMGKAPVGVARLAKKYRKPVIAFSGSVAKEARRCNEQGIDAFFPNIKTVYVCRRSDENRDRRRKFDRYGRTSISSVENKRRENMIRSMR